MRSDNRSGNVWVYPFRDGFRVYFRVGGRMNGTRTFRTQAEADEERDRIRAEITMRSRSVRSAFDAFKKDMAARSVGGTTIERVERDGVRLLAAVLEDPLAALTSRRAESLYVAIATSGEFAAGTHQMSLKVSKAFGAWCAHPRRRWLRENPFAAVEKLGKVADHRSESLRVNEARAFREKAIEFARAGDDGALAALLALITSLRPSEIVQLAARDVDDGGAILWIAGAKVKTANTRRPIEIADRALRTLLVNVAAGKQPTERLFPYASNFPTRSAQRVAESIDIGEINARMLRRTFASLAARRGWSLDAVAFGMGHGVDPNASTAKRHYIAPGARETGAAGRVRDVLDRGKVRNAKKQPA
jgi:integrase